MRKKSQGLSINVIIIVAIGLIIMVVLIAIFTGRLGIFSKGLDTAGGSACDNVCSALGRSVGGDVVIPGALDKEGDQCTCGDFV